MLMESRGVPGESLFYRLLPILHGLLGSSQLSWLKSKRVPKVANESLDFCGFEKEVAESLQVSSWYFPPKAMWLCMGMHILGVCLYSLVFFPCLMYALVIE